MARSWRKPYDTGALPHGATRKVKRLSAKRARKDMNLVGGMDYRRVSNSWDIHDYSILCADMPNMARK